MIEDIINIAREAGEVIKEGFNRTVNIEFKTSESNLVTETDKASEKIITDFIKKRYPSHNILAEESGNLNKISEFQWVIDPLDGTTNFAHKLPIFSVSIGLQKNGQTIAGAVYDVMQNNLYSAEAGAGAYLNGQKITVSNNDNIGRSLLVTGFPYNLAENPFNAFEKFTAVSKKVRGVRRLGSAAIDLCYVARGVFDGFWEVYLNPWDICAGKLIVEEAGGKVTDFAGKGMDIFNKQILATNNRVHNQILGILQKN